MVARFLPAIGRGILLVAVWAFALFMCAQAAQAINAHNHKSAEVAALEDQYNASEDEHKELLEQGKLIATDPEIQRGILKDNYGYTLRDETPIMVLPE